jgi:hypothetical protein
VELECCPYCRNSISYLGAKFFSSSKLLACHEVSNLPFILPSPFPLHVVYQATTSKSLLVFPKLLLSFLPCSSLLMHGILPNLLYLSWSHSSLQVFRVHDPVRFDVHTVVLLKMYLHVLWCDAVSLGEWFPTFWRIILPYRNPLKWRDPLIQQHKCHIPVDLHLHYFIFGSSLHSFSKCVHIIMFSFWPVLAQTPEDLLCCFR